MEQGTFTSVKFLVSSTQTLSSV